MQRNVRASLCQKCAAGIAKHPAADRGRFTITYWLLYCKYILLVSSKSSSLSCLWMFCVLRGGQWIFSVQWLETSWKFPLLGFSGPQEKTYNLSIRCQDLPRGPQPADPRRPLRGSVLPAAFWVHRCIELPCSRLLDSLTGDPPCRWPVAPQQMCSPWSSFIERGRVFELSENKTMWVFKFTPSLQLDGVRWSG